MVLCNEPSSLALNNFWCFCLISTKYAAVIAIDSNADHKLYGQCTMSVDQKMQNIVVFYKNVHAF